MLRLDEVNAMTRPEPLVCGATGCQYSTPESCPTWDQMIKVMDLHVRQAQGNSSRDNQGLVTDERDSLGLSLSQESERQTGASSSLNGTDTRGPPRSQIRTLLTNCGHAPQRSWPGSVMMLGPPRTLPRTSCWPCSNNAASGPRTS